MESKTFRPEVWTRRKLELSASKILGEETTLNTLTGNMDSTINPLVKSMERDELVNIIRKEHEKFVDWSHRECIASGLYPVESVIGYMRVQSPPLPYTLTQNRINMNIKSIAIALALAATIAGAQSSTSTVVTKPVAAKHVVKKDSTTTDSTQAAIKKETTNRKASKALAKKNAKIVKQQKKVAPAAK